MPKNLRLILQNADKMLFSHKNILSNIFLFLHRNISYGTYQKCLLEAMIPNNKQLRAKTGLLRAEGLNNFGRQVR